MNVVIVGGVAAGDVVDMRDDASLVRLTVKLRVKVLASPNAAPEFDELGDIYEIHVIQVINTGEKKPERFGIGVVNGQTLVWGMQQLMLAYQREQKTKEPDNG